MFANELFVAISCFTAGAPGAGRADMRNKREEFDVEIAIQRCNMVVSVEVERLREKNASRVCAQL